MHDLNREQRQALECDSNSHCLVIAGPGSGKTRFLVERMKQCVQIATDCRVLCFAFTNESANEIQARVSESVSIGQRVSISTIHRFCTGILRTHARITRPGSPALRILKDAEQFATFIVDNLPLKLVKTAWKDMCNLMKENGEPFSLSSGTDSADSGVEMKMTETNDEGLRAAKSLVRLLRGLHSGATDIDSIRSYPGILQAFQVYGSAMESANLVDMRCIVGRFLRDFEKLAPLLVDLRYLLVDEFQDLDQEQLELVKLLIRHGMVLTAVGDFNQSIYTWRSRGSRPDQRSDPKRFKKSDAQPQPTSYDFVKRDMSPGSHAEFAFLLNHRNDYEIARASNLLVSRPAVTSDEIPTGLGMARVVVCGSSDEEVTKILQLLRCMHINGTLKECAILVRYNSDKERVRSVLKQAGIPTIDRKRIPVTRKSTGNSSNATKSFKTVLCLIRAIANQNDPEAFITAMKITCMTAHNVDIELSLVRTLSICRDLSPCREWWDMYETYDPLGDTKHDRDCDSINLDDMKYDTRTLSGIRIKSLVTMFLTNIRKCTHILTLESLVEGIKNVFKIKTTKDIALLEDLVRDRHIPLCDSIRFLRDPDSWGRDDVTKDAVYVSTIHSAKGREWSTVIIPFVNEGTIPSIVGEIGEEKRVLYVGMTRAKNNLILTCHQAGRTLPSRFISDCQIQPCERFDDILSRFG